MSGETAIFSIHDKKDYEIHEIVQQVYDALKEKGYNPVNQLVGYILSGQGLPCRLGLAAGAVAALILL